MKITIVYDNKIAENIAGLKAGWGFSCFIVPRHCTKNKKKILTLFPKNCLEGGVGYQVDFRD